MSSAGPGHDLASVKAQPGFGGAPGWVEGLNRSPEARGMVELDEVGEFVGDEVVANEGRGLDEAPIEGEGALAGTGTPTTSLGADADAVESGLKAVALSGRADQRGKFVSGQSAQLALHLQATVGRWIRERSGEIRQLPLAGSQEDERFRLTTVPDLGSVAPRALGEVRIGQGGSLALNPRGHPLHEATRVSQGAASGQRHPNSSIGQHTQQVSAGSGVMDELDRSREGSHGAMWNVGTASLFVQMTCVTEWVGWCRDGPRQAVGGRRWGGGDSI